MATASLVFGGMVGFLLAAVGLAVFGLTFLHALALWSLSGLVVAAVMLVAARGNRASHPRLETARV